MKSYQIVHKMESELESIRCDICSIIFFAPKDHEEIDSFHLINFIAGYDSVFGDGNEIECDICDACFYLLIKDFCRISNNNHNLKGQLIK